MELKKNGNLALKLLFLMVLGVTVTSCGGGNPAGSSSSSASSGSGSGTDTGTDTTTTDTIRKLGAGTGSSFVNGAMDVSDGTLSAGGTTSLSVDFVNSKGELSTDSVSVTFNSECVASGNATLSSSKVDTTTGIASTNYTAAGCEGVDTVTATAVVGTQALSASTQLTIAPAEIGSVDFVGASSYSLAFQGSGTDARPSKSTLTFKVLDKNGNGVKGKTVSFTLSSEVGGITLSSASATTDQSGAVTTTLNAGTVTTTVSVKATYTTDSGATLYTTSQSINVNIGLADQDSFSMGVDSFNPNAFETNGTEVNVTISAADKNNNNVPDGTIINFVTSAGRIPGSCVTSSGSCTVKWTSSNPRKADGAVIILARTVGEESFTDLNSNGKFDTNELSSVSQLGDAWLDLNFDGVRDVSEPYYDFDANESYTPANTLYNGANCTDGTKIVNGEIVADSDNAVADGHCASLVEVRRYTRIVMSSYVLATTINDGNDINVSGGNQTVHIAVADKNGNCPPNGTSVEITLTNGVVITGDLSYTIGSVPACYQTPYDIPLTIGTDGTHNAGGALSVKVTAPGTSAINDFVNVTD